MNWNAFSETNRKLKKISLKKVNMIFVAPALQIPTPGREHYCGFGSPRMQRAVSRAIINSSSVGMT